MVLTKNKLHIGVIKMTDKPEWAECTKEEDYHRYMSDWKDVIVKHLIDGYGVLEWQYYQHMVNHAGWCPCLFKTPMMVMAVRSIGKAEHWVKTEDGNYECFYCRKRADEND